MGGGGGGIVQFFRQRTVLIAGQTLVTSSTSELQSTSTTTIPAANSVAANTQLNIYVADEHRGITTTHNVTGGDTLVDQTGSDTSLVVTWLTGGYVVLTSNGIDEWRI